MDYFLARYYSSAQGRFTSPDEFTGGPDEFWILGSGDSEKQALPYANTTNPQSLNKYQYCFNNPLRYVDPDGHQESAQQAMDRNVKDLAEGRISEDEYWARQRGPALGVGVGLAAVGAAVLGPRVGLAILGWMARNPDKVQQIAGALQEAGGGPPAVSSSLNVNAAAKSFGFKGGVAVAGNAVSGELKNGASVLASFAKAGNELGVRVTMVAGPKGTLQAIEQGAVNAAREAGALSVRLTANLPSKGIGRLLRREGFTQVVENGKATGNWEKVLKVSQ